MKIIDTIISANHNLLRAKLRTTLTILAIFVGGFTLSLTTALNAGANQYLQRQLGNVAVPGIFEVLPKTNFNPLTSTGPQPYDPNKKSTSLQQLATSAGLNGDDVTNIQKVNGVESATPLYNVAPEYITRTGASKYQVPTLEQHIGLNLDLAAGRLPTSTDDHAVILPEDYLNALNFSEQTAVGKTVQIAYRDQRGKLTSEDFTVVGVMRKTFLTSGTIFIDVNSAKRIATAQGQGARYMAIIAKFKNVTNSTDESVLKQRLQSSGNYTAASLKERIGTVTSIVDAITTGLNVVGIIALLAASFGIINTLLMSVYERTQEIGLMKALGMHRRTVFAIFAFEAISVGFWGSVVACGVAFAASFGINHLASTTFLKDFEGFTLLSVTPGNILFVTLLIMAIAFLAGTIPAIKASRLNPIEALRGE